MPNTLGNTTKSKFAIDPEAHKLSIAFDVAAGSTVNKGDAVKLNAAGEVVPAAALDSRTDIIGYSIHDGVGDDGDEVTIVMRGYAVVYAEAAAASLDAGPVVLGAYNSTTGNREFATQAANADELIVGHNITQVAADGDEIRVVLL